jgi:hypothetical protein
MIGYNLYQGRIHFGSEGCFKGTIDSTSRDMYMTLRNFRTRNRSIRIQCTQITVNTNKKYVWGKQRSTADK